MKRNKMSCKNYRITVRLWNTIMKYHPRKGSNYNKRSTPSKRHSKKSKKGQNHMLYKQKSGLTTYSQCSKSNNRL